MAIIDSVYQYYLSTYGNTAVSRYDTHKKSQLRTIYNNIVKTNKESPLYKIKDSGDVPRFAIDIKESARSIQNVIASLSDTGGSAADAFSKKVAQSSDEDAVSAEYVGDALESDSPDSSSGFDIEVMQLASPQINRGEYLSKDKSDIKPGSYSFDLNTNLNSYEFQFNVGPKDTNRDVQDKLVRLINVSNVGLHAEILEDANGNGAVSIESKQTGLDDNEHFLFEIMPSPDNNSIKAIHTLGINRVQKMAHNSSFLLNGKERASLSNTFTVNNMFELTLKKVSSDGPVQVGFKTNADAIADNIQSLVDVYNNIVQVGHNYSATQPASRLLHDISGVARDYHNELESMGLSLANDGSLSVDRSLLTDAVTAEDAEDCFETLNEFKDSLNEKASVASINPMNYVNKIIVTYKNPGHNFATPYITSIYSGMMMDQYC